MSPPRHEAPGEFGQPGAPALAYGNELDTALVVVVGQQDPDLKTVGRQRRKDVVAPLDEGDAVLKEFGNGEILGIAELLDAVGVEMVDDHVALVAIGEGEGRTGDGLIDADRPSEALGEVGLACAEITDEHEEIAIDDQGGNLGRQGLGSGDVGGGAGDHPSRLPTVLRMAVSTATTASIRT